jgi:hypothetical protein
LACENKQILLRHDCDNIDDGEEEEEEAWIIKISP